jgi:PhnB protein
MGSSQKIFPMLSYEDGNAAIEWLCKAFGFLKKEQLKDKEGNLSHGEVELSGQKIMLATPSSKYISPGRLRDMVREVADMYDTPYIIDGVLVYVDNIEKHFLTAKENGAIILSGIETDFPGKRYRAEDPEGHRWMFMELNL